MSLEEYTPIKIDKFMGLYKRGLADDCPQDHSPDCLNVIFNRKGETSTRSGTALSFNFGSAVKSMFVATFNNNDNILLTCDGAGNIYRQDTGAVLLSVANMVDFAALNIFNFCLISPILSSPALSNPVYIWNPLTVPIRKAAGIAPTASFSAVESTAFGNCDIGIHEFAVSFVTNSGYTTPPGPVIAGVFTAVTVSSTGAKAIDLSGIPTGPPGTVARQLFATQADQKLFFYVPFNGFINDNTTTSLRVNFFDTDLAVSADALFDLLPVIPGGNYGLAGGIVKYHGRTFYFGGEFDLVRATNPGDCESIDNVSGFIQLPSEFDGNIVRGACSLQDVLYFTKAVGIYSVTDNGGVPSSWAIIPVDGGVGASLKGMSTITMSQPALSQNQVILMADFGGLYNFTGAIQQPPLTWKINDLWSNFTLISTTLTLAVDPYNKIIYVLSLSPQPVLLAGDYNDGLDADNIKWSQYTFPFTPSAIGMVFIQDLTDQQYRLRIGSGMNVYKLQPSATQDLTTPINSYYSTFYAAYEYGALNIFRFIRARATGSGSLIINLKSEDGALAVAPPVLTLNSAPGRDLLREFNFTNEKCSVKLGTNSSTNNFRLQRVDIFGKVRFPMRPQV